VNPGSPICRISIFDEVALFFLAVAMVKDCFVVIFKLKDRQKATHYENAAFLYLYKVERHI